MPGLKGCFILRCDPLVDTTCQPSFNKSFKNSEHFIFINKTKVNNYLPFAFNFTNFKILQDIFFFFPLITQIFAGKSVFGIRYSVPMSFAIGISSLCSSIFGGDWLLVTDYYLSFTTELPGVTRSLSRSYRLPTSPAEAKAKAGYRLPIT